MAVSSHPTPQTLTANYGIRDNLCANCTCVLHPGSENELDEASQLIGIFGVYALFRIIVPRNIEPDYELYARLWKVQVGCNCAVH